LRQQPQLPQTRTHGYRTPPFGETPQVLWTRELAPVLNATLEAGASVAASRDASTYSRYGSTTFKQLYIYGGLDMSPTELSRSYGFSWAVGGWLLTPFLMKAGPAEVVRLRQRVVDEIKTTFASHYTRTISLVDALKPENIAVYNRRATGEKFLINPSL
jgi:hypothetical protein